MEPLNSEAVSTVASPPGRNDALSDFLRHGFGMPGTAPVYYSNMTHVRLPPVISQFLNTFK